MGRAHPVWSTELLEVLVTDTPSGTAATRGQGLTPRDKERPQAHSHPTVLPRVFDENPLSLVNMSITGTFFVNASRGECGLLTPGEDP